MEKIVILGIGNILLQDEGLGVKVIQSLHENYRFPENVQVLDGGTLGMGLISFLEGTDKLIIVDAISGELPPGSIYELREGQVKAYFDQKISLHDLGIQDVLATMDVLGKSISEVLVFGIQPQTIDVGLNLSHVVETGIPRLRNLVVDQLIAWKVEVEPIGE